MSNKVFERITAKTLRLGNKKYNDGVSTELLFDNGEEFPPGIRNRDYSNALQLRRNGVDEWYDIGTGMLGTGALYIDWSDSTFQLDASHNGKTILVDVTDGPVNIRLPSSNTHLGGITDIWYVIIKHIGGDVGYNSINIECSGFYDKFEGIASYQTTMGHEHDSMLIGFNYTEDSDGDFWILGDNRKRPGTTTYDATSSAIYLQHQWVADIVHITNQAGAIDVHLGNGLPKGHRQKIMVSNGGSFYPVQLKAHSGDVIETVDTWGHIEVEALVDFPYEVGDWRVLDVYEETFHQSTFKFNGTSGGTSATAYFNLVRNNKMVTFQMLGDVKATTGTSSNSFVMQTAMPARFRPTALNAYIPVPVVTNNAFQQWWGYLNMPTDGVVAVFKDFIGTAWANSNPNSGFARTVFSYASQY